MTKAYFDGQWKEEYAPLLTIQQGWLRGPDHKRIAWNSALHYDMIFNQPVVHEFPDVEVPALLIIGTRDRTAVGRNRAPEEKQKELGRYDRLGAEAAEAIPNAKLVELEGIGHVPQYEAYDDYIEALTDFLSAQR